VSSTAQDRRNALLFVAAALGLLLLAIGLLSARSLSERQRRYVVAFTESVTGLEPSSVVRYRGVPVGQVRDIRLRAGSLDVVEVEVGIRADLGLKQDTRAQLRPQGITGLYALELLGGSAGAPDLEEGGTLLAEVSILSTLEATLRDVADMARGLRGSEAEARATVRELRDALVATRDAARGIQATAAAVGTGVEAGVQALRDTTSDLRALLAEPAWREAGPELVGALRDLRRATGAVERAASAVSEVGEQNQADLRALVLDLRRAGGDVRAVARRVRESPASLLVEHPRPDKPFPDPLPAHSEEAP
jgi:phospholipid/cholesterol/gamma-HCH transport system substrate-binding protein